MENYNMRGVEKNYFQCFSYTLAFVVSNFYDLVCVR